MREKTKSVLKVALSISLVALVIYQSDIGKIYRSIIGASLKLILVATVLHLLNAAISAEKLRILIKTKGSRIAFWPVFQYYLIGKLFNSILPSTIGGDAVKAEKISKHTEMRIDAYSSVVFERILGLFALLLIISLAGIRYFHRLPTVLEIAVILTTAGFSGSIIFLILMNKLKISDRIPEKEGFPGLIIQKVLSSYHVISEFGKDRKVLGYTFLLSLIFHILFIGIVFILAEALNISIPIYFLLVFVPLADLISAIPISLGGLGVREAIYVYLLSFISIASAQAVSLSLMIQFLIVFAGIMGGIALINEEGF